MQTILLVLQIFLAFCQACMMLYIFRSFLRKPTTDLEEEVTKLKVEVAEIKQSLYQGNDRFRELESAKEVILHSIMALIEFEIEYCITEHKIPSDGLKAAKDDLNSFLAGKRGKNG